MRMDSKLFPTSRMWFVAAGSNRSGIGFDTVIQIVRRPINNAPYVVYYEYNVKSIFHLNIYIHIYLSCFVWMPDVISIHPLHTYDKSKIKAVTGYLCRCFQSSVTPVAASLFPPSSPHFKVLTTHSWSNIWSLTLMLQRMHLMPAVVDVYHPAYSP